ncbi:hypothetical protein BerOc1_02935 [Pseudodesulfovibrio hydrargyri]|uniref:DUF2975 domain-containing protein n=1 Tax=Pseudodesulfovibrio hydrargyri TaxID=2125990 RepID=A0A1J5MWT7_9BACT|nr:DUF2975 domain-containing protein [Pseudodesulfovibrio hydrargyri]OIQ50990.1 hypothetical protein BerOc1_02935 [Pseudodesulfovibrio hydrargyri]
MEQRIQRFARVFRVIFAAAFVLSPVIVATLWLTGGDIMFKDGGSATVIGLVRDNVSLDAAHAPAFPLAWSQRWLGLAVSLIPLGATMLCLWWLARLFGLFSAGEIFTGNTVKYIRRTGWTMLAGVALMPIHEALLTLVLTMRNPPGERLISISLESGDIRDLLIAGIIILVSWIMDEGRKLRETDELTV